MIRIAVLGCGRIGLLHAGNVARSTRAELVAVADALPEAAKASAERHGTRIATLDDIIDKRLADAVIVGTPTDTHADIVERCANQGIAVLCEKPVDLSADRIRHCIAAVDQTSVPVVVAFNHRFDPHYAVLRKEIMSGAAGKPEILTLVARDPGPPPLTYIEHSGGIFRDMMIHDLDMVRFLLGEEPVEVYATGAVLFDKGIGGAGDFDTALAILKMQSGCVVQLSASRRAVYGFDNRTEVHCADALLAVGNMPVSQVVVARKDGFHGPRHVDFFPERYRDSYVAELDGFIDMVEHGGDPRPSLRDGLAAQVLADLATESARTGQPIKVPPLGV